MNAKAFNTYILPQLQLQWRFLCRSQSGVKPISQRLSPHPQTLTWEQTAVRSPGLLFNGLDRRNPCNYMDCYSFTDPEEMEG